MKCLRPAKAVLEEQVDEELYGAPTQRAIVEAI